MNMRRMVVTCCFMSVLLNGMPYVVNASDETTDERIQQLEQSLKTLQDRLKESPKGYESTVEDRLEKLERTQPTSQGGEAGNMVFFRGGGFRASSDRSNETFSDVFGAQGLNDGNKGYYIGAGLDMLLSKNLWGLLSDTWALGEIGVEFKRFNSKKAIRTSSLIIKLPKPLFL